MIREIKRKENWDKYFNDFIEAARKKEFDWQDLNCALFACEGVLAFTGEDFAVNFRGLYDTKEEAEELIKKECGGDLQALATLYLGPPRLKVNAAETGFWNTARGDVCLLESPEGKALGLCLGQKVAFMTHNVGFVLIPLRKCSMSWRI